MSLESEGKEMSRLNTHRHTYIHTYRHVNIELEFCETEFAKINMSDLQRHMLSGLVYFPAQHMVT